jgi:nucleotide-binding universal stress UspA family protein
MTATIVCGIDSTPTATAAARRAAELAAAFGGRLHLISAYGKVESVEVGADQMTVSNELEADRVTAATADKLRTDFPNLEITTVGAEGRPSEALVKAAGDLHADVIVVGNKRVQGISRVLGSVARAVMTHAPCDVYVVHTHEHR